MISLYFVNLLPLQFLDGNQILAIVAEMMFKEGNGSQGLDIAERGFRSWSMRSDGRIKRRRYLFKTGVLMTTWTVVISFLLLSLLHWYQGYKQS
jgi:membrane-associated protease RseP (regulator of RpoE activity)